MSERQQQVQALNAHNPSIYNWELLACLEDTAIHQMWLLTIKGLE